MRILVIGCIGIDTNVYFYGDGPNFEHEGNFTQNIDYIGQAGGYTTRLLKAMGHEPQLIASVGSDYHGDFIRRQFLEDGVDVSGLFHDPLGTNRSINFMYADGRRKNFYDGKGNFDLKVNPSDFLQQMNGAVGAHFHIANWCRYFLPYCLKRSIPISVDLQDIVDIDDSYRMDFLLAANIVFFSLTNFPDREEQIIENFTTRFPNKKFIAGNGSKGCWFAYQGKISFYPAILEGDPVIDTNGAGDALACGVLHELWDRKSDAPSACQIGQKLARMVCSMKATSTFDYSVVNKILIGHHPHR